MPESTTTTVNAQKSSDYWKTCSILLGIGFVLSLMAHTGPSSTHAAVDTPPAWQAMYDGAQQAQQVLTVDGFENIDGELYFVMANQDGEHIGVMAMPAKSED
jgi:hypothetical protein